MKQFKLLFSLMTTAALFFLAGCGSNGSDPIDIGTKVLELDKKIMLQGAIHSYRTGEALPKMEVRLFLNGKWVTSKAEHNGEYFFDEVFAERASNNSNNNLLLTFVETLTDNKDVNDNKLYENGTIYPTYPDSRVHIVVIDPEHITGIVNPNGDSLGFEDGTSSLTSLDLDTPFKPDIVLEMNTVKTQDIRLVPAGTLTGNLVDSSNGNNISGATVTIDSDAIIGTAAAGNDDVLAGWDHSIRHATSGTDGSVVYSNATGNPAPGVDYDSLPIGVTMHAEKIGYSDKTINAALVSANADIKDDLVGSFGTVLMDPFTLDLVTFKLTVLDQNFALLTGAVVTISPTKAGTWATLYETALSQNLTTAITYTTTTGTDGVATLTVPAYNYNAAKDFTVTYTDGTTTIYCIKLDGFSPYENTVTDLNVDLHNDVGAKDTIDLGQICIGPKTLYYHPTFVFQVVYNSLPVQGAIVTGHQTTDLNGALSSAGTFRLAGGTSDASGFVTLLDVAVDDFTDANEELVLKFDLSAVTSQFDGSFAGKKYVLASPGVLSTDKLSTTINAAAMLFETVKTGESGLAAQVVLAIEDQALAALTGYIVKTNTTDNTFIVADAINLALTVTSAGVLDKTYFATTDSTGFYSFSATNGVKIPVGIAVTLNLKVLGDYQFSEENDDSISLDAVVTADNGVEQLAAPNTSWLWQFQTGTIAAKYDGTSLVVHTAAIEDDLNLKDVGYHVVTVAKSIGTSTTLTNAVAITDGDDDIALTFTLHGTEAGNSSVSLNILMSGNVNTTYSLTNTEAAPAADKPKENRVYVAAANFNGAGTFAGTTEVDGERFVTTATVSGRTLTITPEGNANKFQEEKIYRIVVKVWDTNDNESDDVIYVKFYNANAEVYTVTAPTIDFNALTAARNWTLSNLTATVAANFRVIVDKGLAPKSQFVVSNVNTGFGPANAGLQSANIGLAALIVRFPIPTNSSGTVLTDTEATAIDNEFDVWAQAYTQSGIILRHWTKVDALTGTNGDLFNVEENGFFKTTTLDLDTAQEFEDALIAGHKIDIIVVHKDNIIAATAANSLTLSVANLAGVQVKTITTNAALNASTFAVGLSEDTDASITAAPTMTETVLGLSIGNVRYTAKDVISGDAVYSTTGFSTVSTDDAANRDISSDSIPGLGTLNAVYLSNSISSAALTVLSTQFRPGLTRVDYDANGDADLLDAGDQDNAAVTAVNTLTATMTQVDDITNEGNATNMFEDVADNSTTTAVDIDFDSIQNAAGGAGPDMSNATTLGALTGIAGAGGDLFYSALTAGTTKDFLNNLIVGDMLFINTVDVYLTITAVVANTSIAFDIGAAAGVTDIRDSFGWNSNYDTVIIPKSFKVSVAVAANANDGSLTADGGTTGLRASTLDTYTVTTTTSVVIGDNLDLVIGDTLYFVMTNGTSTTNAASVFSATVTASYKGAATTVVTLSAATKLSGWATALNDSLFTPTFVAYYGEQVTVGLGTGVGSLLNINTSGTNASAGTGDVGINPSATAIGDAALGNAEIDDTAGTGGYEAVK
ncbi:MAG: hypothetical protein COA79_09780 [Planctomycetota bacterium]|nr:MAG: hypothetical protein COA79_09780 [Planctomycetota bacterium]